MVLSLECTHINTCMYMYTGLSSGTTRQKIGDCGLRSICLKLSMTCYSRDYMLVCQYGNCHKRMRLDFMSIGTTQRHNMTQNIIVSIALDIIETHIECENRNMI